MNYKKPSKISEELQNVIISVAYGNASFWEKRRIEKLASKDEQVREMLDEYAKTAKVVHSISKKEYMGSVKIERMNDSQKSIFDDIYLMIIGKPIVASMATIALIFALTFSFINNQELPYKNYSLSEVQKANIEAKQALQIVNRIFTKTESIIKYDILTKEVSKPIKDGMNTVNKLFKKETKNEYRENKS
jgi:hypothetical protein